MEGENRGGDLSRYKDLAQSHGPLLLCAPLQERVLELKVFCHSQV